MSQESPPLAMRPHLAGQEIEGPMAMVILGGHAGAFRCNRVQPVAAVNGSASDLGRLPRYHVLVISLAAADDQGEVLPQDLYPPGPTPWDPALRRTFHRERHIVHQERLLPGLIE